MGQSTHRDGRLGSSQKGFATRPFIDTAAPLGPQMAVLLGLIIVIEFGCLLVYAQGGRSLSELLVRKGQGRLLNRISAVLMAGVAVWLVLA